MDNNQKKENKDKIKTTPMDADIINLNNDDSFAPINEEQEKTPLTEEEKEEVRKKLSILLVVIFLALVFLVVILIFDPFTKSEDKKEENKTEEKEEPTTTTHKKIKDYQDGEIDLTNGEIAVLIEEITLREQEHYENDALTLFYKDTDINSLNDNYKLFLMSKTSDFNSILLSKATNTDFCQNEFKIEKSIIDDLLKERFNTTITKYEDFLYHYYDYDGYNTTLKFTYANNEYTGACYHPNNVVKTAIQQEVIKATKDGNNLYLDCNVIFINETGIYKDPSFKETIASGQSSSPKLYVSKGNIYRYKFDISQNNYHLTNVSIQK